MPANRGLVEPLREIAATCWSNALMCASLLSGALRRRVEIEVFGDPRAVLRETPPCTSRMRRRASARSWLSRLMLSRSMYQGTLTASATYASTISRAMGSVVVFESSCTSRSPARRSFAYSSSSSRSKSRR